MLRSHNGRESTSAILISTGTFLCTTPAHSRCLPIVRRDTMGMIPDKDLPGPYFFREYTLVLDSPSRRSLMERTLEEIARVAASPESVIGLLSTDPAAALTGMSSPDTRLFAAEMAVEL